MALSKDRMPETMYRASRFFRVLGNPTAYLIVRSLGTGAKTPGMLSEELGVSLPTISATLRHMRQVDLVRYRTAWKNKEYSIKDTQVLKLVEKAEDLTETMRSKRL